MRLRALILVVALSAAAIAPAWAAPETVAILLSGSGGGYSEVASGIRDELQGMGEVDTRSAVLGRPEADALLEGAPRLLIAVGIQATATALRNAPPKVPLLSVLVPSASFHALLASADPPAGRRSISAVFLDQPPARMVELIRQALPHATRIGLVVGSESAKALEPLKAAASARGLRILAEPVRSDAELFPALQRTMAETDLFLALPDPQAVNPENAQNLLITSYRMRRPVVAYSAAYVRAGALVAVFSTPAQSGAQAGEIARAVLRGAALPAPRYPDRFSVAVNRQVARAFGLTLPEDESLRELIVQQEQR